MKSMSVGEAHKTSNACKKNYDGTSGGMEEKAAVNMWNRSLDHKLRYITFIGDGDASAHKAVTLVNDGAGPYGQEKRVVKAESINHVHKRMGTSLRKLVNEYTEEYKTNDGKIKQRKLLSGD